MNGRVYDYNVGRFMSVDPVIQSPTNSQSINPYSYIMNNPLSGTDPSGYSAEKLEIEIKVAHQSTTGSHVVKTSTVTATVEGNGKDGFTVTFKGESGAVNAVKAAATKALGGEGFAVADIGNQTSLSEVDFSSLSMKMSGRDFQELQSSGALESIGQTSNWNQIDRDASVAAFNTYSNDDGGLLAEKNITYEPTDGFQAALFSINGKYYLAFRGTEIDKGYIEGLKDIKNNLLQAIRLSASQYEQAVDLAVRVEQALKGEVMFVGHSLGGGLATAAANATKGEAITFNAAGVGGRYNTNSYTNIRAHIIRGEFLSSIQNRAWDLPDTVGTRIYHESPEPLASSAAKHSMSNFMNFEVR